MHGAVAGDCHLSRQGGREGAFGFGKEIELGGMPEFCKQGPGAGKERLN